jgi:5-formyltetrahydrofolate cyclo-ligase
MTPVSAIAAEKARLRAEALARRDRLDPALRQRADAEIARHALSLPVWGEGPVAGYWPMRSEVDPRPILMALHATGIPLCLPAVVDGALRFRAFAPGLALISGGFGTRVPPPDSDVMRPAALLVPLAAFDARGFRLGYGKGHYDRALASLPGARRIGIAYAAQQVADVPIEAHDVALEMVVTENGVMRAVQP